MIKWGTVQGLGFKEFEYNKENACWNRNNKNVNLKDRTIISFLNENLMERFVLISIIKFSF